MDDLFSSLLTDQNTDTNSNTGKSDYKSKSKRKSKSETKHHNAERHLADGGVEMMNLEVESSNVRELVGNGEDSTSTATYVSDNALHSIAGGEYSLSLGIGISID